MNNILQKSIEILLIQADELERKIIKNELSATGLTHRLTEAENLKQGIELIKASDFDVLLLDHLSLESSDIKSISHLNNETDPQQPAVIMIALDDDKTILEYLADGAQDFLYKANVSTKGLKRALLKIQFNTRHELTSLSTDLKLKQLIEQDSLTGLFNRQYFDKHLTEHFEQAEPGRDFALILLDINNFKSVNDQYGHHTGDELLKRFAEIIKSTLPNEVLLARLSGDEFAAFLDSRIYDAHLACQSIYRSLEDFVSVGEFYQKIPASIGYAAAPSHANNKTKLFQCAEMALHYSKTNRNQVAYGFSSSMQKASLEKTELKEIIKKGYENNGFSIHYQPIINPDDDSLVGLEALMRLKHNDTYIPPDKFIKVLEEMKLFHELGYWLIEEVFKQQTKWLKKISKHLKLSINLSPVQLNNEKIIAFIFEMIKKYKIKPDLVNFELTETILLDSPSRVKLILKRINDCGCRISLDDFGTGFSSLSHLKEFPINTVKIDKSMVPQNKHDYKTIDIMRGLVVMLHSLNLDIVAEGIETKFQLEFCKELKITKIQGYFYDKPLEPGAVEKKYNNWKSKILNKLPDFK